MASNTRTSRRGTATEEVPAEAVEKVPAEAVEKAPAEAAEETPAVSGGLGFALNVVRAEVNEIKRQAPKRAKEPNPTEDAVKHTRETQEVLAYNGIPTEDDLKKVVGLLRRAAADADHGIKIQTVQADDGTWTVNFCGVEKKRDRKYTADDIRAWAKEQGAGDFTGMKIPANIREGFKLANGFGPKKKASK